MDRLNRIVARAKAPQDAVKPCSQPVRKNADLWEAARQFAAGEGNWA